MFPNRIFLNRGNHEDINLNVSNHFAPNFQQDCTNKFGKYGYSFFMKAQEFFRFLKLIYFNNNN